MRSKAAGVPKSKQSTKQPVAAAPSTAPSSNQVKPPQRRKVRASFAPDNFEFKLNLPLKPVVEEAQEEESGCDEEETPETSTPVKSSEIPDATAHVAKEFSEESAPIIPDIVEPILEVSKSTPDEHDPVPEISVEVQTR